MGLFSRIFGGGVPETLPIRVLSVSIPRETVEAGGGFDLMETTLRKFAADTVAQNRRFLMDLTISGYASDPRQLHEIPAVCDWGRQLFSTVPAVVDFLDELSFKRLVGWCCGPISVDSIATPAFQARYKQEMKRLFMGRRHGSEYLKQAGATQELFQAAGNADFAVMVKLITQFDLTNQQ